MLTIRRQQMYCFEQALIAVWVDPFKEHMLRNFPAFCRDAGEQGIDDEVHYGIARARAYGFETANDICRFLNLQVVLGRDFERLPKNAWMREWLDPNDELHSSARLRSLYKEAIARLRLESRLQHESIGE